MTGSWWQILIACIGFAAGSEAIRQYRAWKNRRRARPYAERNAGFWTDSRLYHAELFGTAIALAPPWGFAVLFLSIERPLWIAPLMLVFYVIAIYLIVVGLNGRER